MKPWQVDKHIDTSCPGSPQPQKASSSSASGASQARNGFRSAFQPPSPAKSKPPERLAALNYSLLKDAALRRKMVELGLSAAGSRQMLERRHQEWITIWNANCDSARPKKRSELLHDLDVWEKTMGSRAPAMSRAAQVGAQIKDKDFDGAAWAAKHDSSFKDLIANARRTRSQAETRAKDASEDETASGDSIAKEVSGQTSVRVDLTIPSSSPSGTPEGEAESSEGESAAESAEMAEAEGEPPRFFVNGVYLPHSGNTASREAESAPSR